MTPDVMLLYGIMLHLALALCVDAIWEHARIRMLDRATVPTRLLLTLLAPLTILVMLVAFFVIPPEANDPLNH